MIDRILAGDRLVYIYREQKVDGFWDENWQDEEIRLCLDLDKEQAIGEYRELFTRLIDKNAPVLEAGCGPCRIVHALNAWGYECVGIDASRKILEKVRKFRKDLDLGLMDVEALALGDSTMGSYISLGVLEYFHYGMEKGLSEAWRVLRPGGLIFISAPHFNALRKFLARSGRFERVPPDQVAVERFYQYALTAGQLREILKKNRFECLEESYFFVIKGLRDELRWLKRLYKFYRGLLGRSPLYRIPAKLVSLLLRLIEKTAELPFIKKRCSHIVMVVAKKSPDPVPTSQPEAP